MVVILHPACFYAMANQIRVVLADDHPLIRAGIRSKLEQAESIQVVGEASDGAEALDLVHTLAPDVLVLDVDMPRLSGVEVARRLQANSSPVQILALSAHDDEQYVFGLLESGAAGYLVKDEAPETVVEAVLGVAQGEEGWLSRRIMAKVMRKRSTRLTKESVHPRDVLSEREFDVLRLLSQGLDNRQIARTLFISESTVKTHCNNLYSKLGVRNRVQAAAWAWQRNLHE